MTHNLLSSRPEHHRSQNPGHHRSQNDDAQWRDLRFSGTSGVSTLLSVRTQRGNCS